MPLGGYKGAGGTGR